MKELCQKSATIHDPQELCLVLAALGVLFI